MIHLDEDLINRHNSLQWRDVNAFIPMCAEALEWGDLANETIMDIGCGPGHNSTKSLLQRFPKVGKIIAVDGSENMIALAEIKNPHPKVQYVVSEIQNKSILQKWRGCSSKLLSVHCLHWVEDQEEAFRNIFQLLVPGGSAALLFVLNGHHFEACEDMRESLRWREMTKNLPRGIPISQSKNLDEAHYKRLLTDIGFDVVLCEKEPIVFQFANDLECKGFMGSICSMLNYIPNNSKSEFLNDLFERFLVRCGRSPDGLPELHCTYIKILLKKRLE